MWQSLEVDEDEDEDEEEDADDCDDAKGIANAAVEALQFWLAQNCPAKLLFAKRRT